MQTDHHDRITRILCDGWFTVDVEGLEYAVQSLVGRGTQVWHVHDEKKRYILKDSWLESSRCTPEMEFLKRASGVEGVPVLEWGGVMVDGTPLSTLKVREDQSGNSTRVRVWHCCGLFDR
jgi:hypothetical protein